MAVRAAVLLATLAAAPVAASSSADTLVSAIDVTSFGNGLVTGAPDGGGLFLSNTFDPPDRLGQFTVDFLTPLGDGPGADLRLHEVIGSCSELFEVRVSSDNIGFTLIGGFNATQGPIDFGGVFGGPVSCVRLVNAGTVNSPDFDALEGLHAYRGVIPEPASWVMLIAGSGLAGASFRRRRAAATA